MDQGLAFAALMREHVQEQDKDEEDDMTVGQSATEATAAAAAAADAGVAPGAGVKQATTTTPTTDGAGAGAGAGGQLVKAEERDEGLVKARVWLDYFRSPGTIFPFILLILSVLVENGMRCACVCACGRGLVGGAGDCAECDTSLTKCHIFTTYPNMHMHSVYTQRRAVPAIGGCHTTHRIPPTRTCL